MPASCWKPTCSRTAAIDLGEFLAPSGYRHVALHRSDAGHFHAPGSLGGRDVSVLIDTGASVTLVSLALGACLGPGDFVAAGKKGGGAGSTNMDLYLVPDATLDLAGRPVRARGLMAMELGRANEALVRKGMTPIEAILGLDVLDAHSAVIDYGSQSLILLS